MEIIMELLLLLLLLVEHKLCECDKRLSCYEEEEGEALSTSPSSLSS